MSASGAFTFVLHGHLPYQPDPRRWSHGDTALYEVIAESYLPLLRTLYDLKQAAVPARLSICLSPTLVEQMGDDAVIKRLNHYLDEQIDAARHDVAYFGPESGDTAEPHLDYLAGWHLDWYTKIKTALNERFQDDLVGAFRGLQDEGIIEIVATAATHAYLPLLGHDSAITAQIKTGLASYQRVFGRTPEVFWLPECGYRPGLEDFLVREGLRVIYVEPHMMTHTPAIGVAAGDVRGPLNTIKLRYMIPWSQTNPNDGVTTVQAYQLESAPELAIIGRDDRATMQVWGAINGYPRDVDYRESQRRFGLSDLPYWRITGDLVDPHDKDYYHPDWARYKVEQHAEHFAHMIGDMIRDYHDSTGNYGLISTHIDARLFGHWWFEGSRWLGLVLRHLASTETIDLMTTTAYLDAHPAQQSIELAEGSWGTGGGHFIWNNPANDWLWPLIHEAEARMETLVKAADAPSDDEAALLTQAARELLLLQSADWPLMMTLHEDGAYALERFNDHLERFNRLADSLESGTPDRSLADAYWEIDHLFPDVDYRVFDVS